ncbi:hypothetical protein P872_06125 [Rhodonellum psychrophilum GCM71 = DSM 17998]|uniref:Plasmid transfer protein n=2 Tax=Rhodonellum TaxID=336827 RepID=U5BYX0_9BACT|nr:MULTISPECIES: hypothetical protein [Rhodonellum]ERM83048.1 hypothetical protein P872_06125 [Rhodonellum psychrophilum GCM71 = DSM 17998]SDZ47384.1 hypothetical protein SAMN05444412_11646 [Rhodonellum ikkaensis]
MKKYLLIFTLSLSLNAFGQINIQLLHQLVENSKSEHEQQLEAKGNQAKNAFHEEVNRNILGEVKQGYKTLQERFAKLTLVFDAVGIANSANPLIRSIIDNQQQILFYCQRDPALLPFAVETEKLFVSQSYSLLNYLIGLAASIGDINQMKMSDRRILFGHILHELKAVHQLSLGTSRTLQFHLKRKTGGNPYQDYVQTEMGLVDEIMSNIKLLKN